MEFDPQGHVRITPAEFQGLLDDPARLVEDALLAGTPAVFPTRAEYRTFIDRAAAALAMHPASAVVRGSATVGFSFTPRPAKVWGAFGPGSDVDLAYVDPDRYHVLDAEVRAYDRHLDPRDFNSKEAASKRNRDKSRSFYRYRFMDLPNVPFVKTYRDAMAELSKIQLGGHTYSVNAFFYRDWWALQDRYEFDLRELKSKLQTGYLHAATDKPRPRVFYDDAALAALPQPAEVRELCLAEMEDVTSGGVAAALARFVNLQSLWLDKLRLHAAEKALAVLPSLGELRKLSLCGMPDVDKYLPIVAKLPRLERLYLDGTDVAPDALRQLRSVASLKFVSVAYCRKLPRKGEELEMILPQVEVHR